MTDKNRRSQAQKAAGTTGGKSGKPSAGREKQARPASAPKKEAEKETIFTPRLIGAVVSLVLFIILLVMYLEPQGALTELIASVFRGLIGNVGFVISIPATLYLFFIFAFSEKRAVRSRVICVVAFVLLCGCISHLTLAPETRDVSFKNILALYQQGVSGKSGGILCGILAMLLQWLCGKMLSYVILGVAAVFTLLGAMQFTIPSIIRAIRNRPRAEWEDEEPEETAEPAAIVVNHIANKHIAYEEKKRLRAEQTATEKDQRKKKSDMLKQIDADVDTPVAASAVKVDYADPEELAAAPKATAKEMPKSDPPKPTVQVPESPKERTLEDPVTEQPIPAQPVQPDPVPEKMPPMPVDNKPEQVTRQESRQAAAEVALEITKREEFEKPQYLYPPISLLKLPANGAADGTAEMRENSRRLNEALQSFKIEAQIVNVTRGPSVTRYEVELDKGVRLSKLTSAADDLALSLGASSVRIAAVEGKISVVGIEVPNRAVTTVSLREVIDSPEFKKAKSKSSFAVGKDISGNCIVGNIAKLPHMLIAGTTGSGKSVCTNSIIISLLYKASPEDVRLIMVDPKMVELGIYNGIPHLLIPVVTDPKKAAGSLQWAVTEMMRRYRAMSDVGVRDLESYNNIITSQEMDEPGEKLPQIVVLIDELADLMLVAAKEVEESICRIAQMGRAAGIHLIIATQRPSADVITGLMKANIPSRIAFSVASAMESRIILDTQGAEKLVGKGDMLYAPIGCGKPKRVQGCFVSDVEVEAVATYVKEHYVTSYDQTVMEEIDKKAAQTGTGKSAPASMDMEPSADELEGDEMLPAAVDVILETGQASVSMLQRRLKLGYARAARIVDEMEEKGIVGPFQGSKPRAILVTKEQWAAMKTGQGAPVEQMDFDDLDQGEEDEPPFDL